MYVDLETTNRLCYKSKDFAPKSNVTKNQRMRDIKIGCLVLFATISCSGCLQLDERRAAAPLTPLIADFRRFCLDTKAQADAVSAVASRQGATPTTTTNDLRPNYRLNKAWIDLANGHAVGVTVGTARITKNSPGEQVFCSVADAEDNGKSLGQLRRWLGLPPSTRNVLFQDFAIQSGNIKLADSAIKLREQNTLYHDIYTIIAVNYSGVASVTLVAN